MSGLQQFGGSQAMAAAFGLQPNTAQPPYVSSSKERSAVLSHDRDILSRDKDVFSRDREYYNTKVNRKRKYMICDRDHDA